MGRKEASVVGYYGMSNYGDDLFGEVIERNASQLLPGYRVRIVGTSVNDTWISRLYASNSPGGSALRLADGMRAVFRSRLIVLGGGSVLSDLTGVRKVQRALSRVTRTKFYALGVSLGPFDRPEARDAVAGFASVMEKLVVRDNSSLAVAESLGLENAARMGGDLAALYRPDEPYPVVTSTKLRRVGIAACSFPGFGVDEAEALALEVSESLARTISAGREDVVVLLALNSHAVHGDDHINHRMADVFSRQGVRVEHVRHADVGVSGIWSTISELHAVVAVRLHAAITAYLTDVPFTLVEYHAKCSEFLGDIGQADDLRFASRLPLDPSSGPVDAVLKTPTLPRRARGEYISRARAAYFDA